MSTYDEGMTVRREVLGDAHVDRAIANTAAFTADFQDLITRYAWGEIWTRPGLDRRSRSMITLTALVARGHHEELVLHLRAARRNGLTVDEIKEVLLQTAIYCGVPDANTAFRIAAQVLADGTGGAGQQHVVHRAAQALADGLDAVQRHRLAPGDDLLADRVALERLLDLGQHLIARMRGGVELTGQRLDAALLVGLLGLQLLAALHDLELRILQCRLTALQRLQFVLQLGELLGVRVR